MWNRSSFSALLKDTSAGQLFADGFTWIHVIQLKNSKTETIRVATRLEVKAE